MADPKAQHYVPKFYLKGFTDKSGVLWVCEKHKPIRSSKPKEEANRPDYYTHVSGEKRNEMAEDILKELESRAAPIIRKLANPQYLLTPENAAQVIMFVAFQFARVPSWREHLDRMASDLMMNHLRKEAGDKEKFYQTCAEIENSNGKKLGLDFEELRQDVIQKRFDIQQSTAFNLGSMVTSAAGIAKELATWGYEGLYAPEGSFFVTSDSPVYTVQPDGNGMASIGMGFGWQNVEVYCPLNKRMCFRMKRGIQPRGVFVDLAHVDQINTLMMMTATQYLYSSQGYRRIARLFDERGCKIQAGKNAFLSASAAAQLKAEGKPLR
ncbi:MAG TPA: DUF4238 domain-containing protein [Terriglobales bacterium]